VTGGVTAGNAGVAGRATAGGGVTGAATGGVIATGGFGEITGGVGAVAQAERINANNNTRKLFIENTDKN